MTTTRSRRPAPAAPDTDALNRALDAVFGRRTTVVERRRHAYASSSPGEIVRCRVDGDADVCVLCKYERGRRAPRFGHRGGPGYEAMVYREVLARVPAGAPRFVGSWDEAGDTWLFVEYLPRARRASESEQAEETLRSAARWTGRFHALVAERPAVIDRRRVKVYDGAYYAGWARRAARLAGEHHRRFPWLAAVCDRAEVALTQLRAAGSTIVHGEFTPDNVLVRDGVILPVDWETAAVAPGEIDVAALTDRWPPDVVRACEREYAQARWPGGAPGDFARSLDLARLYWDLRWLGDRRSWLRQPQMLDRYAALRATAVRLGLLGPA